MSYSLADGTIKIGGVPRRNSGINEGKFLKSMLLQTPESDPNFPVYFTPDRFYIGKLRDRATHTAFLKISFFLRSLQKFTPIPPTKLSADRFTYLDSGGS